tara:strand:+ start:489 stop:788 length:300 start_codon:yes stop_codon:yes gene_type:complete
MNKNAREKELLEEAYASLYERKNPDADTYGGGLTGPFALEQEGPNFEDDELEALIAADVDEEDDIDLDEDKSENKDENITQGGGTSAAAFDAEEKTGYA